MKASAAGLQVAGIVHTVLWEESDESIVTKSIVWGKPGAVWEGQERAEWQEMKLSFTWQHLMPQLSRSLKAVASLLLAPAIAELLEGDPAGAQTRAGPRSDQL